MALIVVADDEPDLRSLFAQTLEGRGHTVVQAEDGAEALEAVRRHRPDLLLLDVWMPRMSGFEVLDALRSDAACQSCRVLIISVLDDAETQLELFGSGAVDFLTKGRGIGELIARVDDLLAHRVVPSPSSPPHP